MNKKLKSKWLLLLSLAMGAFGVTACSDDYDPWELLKTEVTSTIPQNNLEKVAWNGGTFTINVKTNGSWNIEVPEWLSVDKSEGNGDATIEATVERAWRAGERTGEIKLNTAGSESCNIAGRNDQIIEFKQEGLENALKITDCNAAFTKQLIEGKYPDGSRFSYYQCGYKITYNINNELTDEEFNDMVNGVYLYTYKNTKGYPYGFRDTYYLSKTDLTKGTHVLENSDCWRYGNSYGDYFYLLKIEIAIQTKYGIKVIYSTDDIKK